MGCDVHVLVVGGRPSLLQVARERIEELEQRWSRFLATSEISRLNALAGLPVRLSPITVGLVERALEGARVTGGRYDPTVLGDVLRAGYDRSFERLTGEAPRGTSPLGQGYDRIVVDLARSTVTLPLGVGLDPGGIGKGYAADLLVEELLPRGAAGACVNVGGDLRVWFTARASGIVAWALAASTVIWGLAFSTRVLGRRPRPAWLFDLHRFLGGLTLSFTGVHALAVIADSYVHFSLVNVFVPLTGDWHPLAVAWGIVGSYLLLAIELTSLARAHLPRTLWRRVHYASFALFAVTTVHGLSAGSDRRSPAFLVAVVATCGVVAVLTAARVMRPSRRLLRSVSGPAT
jgi:hypothetical protein